MKKSLMPVLAGTLILTMTACGQKAPTKIDTIKANGELRIAVTDVHSLNCEYDANTNTYTGVEPDFASFIAEDLGVSPTFVQMNLDD
ncbi:MAG: hypothetical protein MJ119_08880, partial [Lachnospiraceae bacterium]|nr:hypothetical protein [Lachnospiraceae bacterium]